MTCIEGVDLADVIEHVITTELIMKPKIQTIPNYEYLIELAGETAKQYVIEKCDKNHNHTTPRLMEITHLITM